MNPCVWSLVLCDWLGGGSFSVLGCSPQQKDRHNEKGKGPFMNIKVESGVKLEVLPIRVKFYKYLHDILVLNFAKKTMVQLN